MSNRLLAAFFLSLMAGLLDFILLQHNFFNTYSQYAFLLNSLVILHTPFLLLYTQSITKSEFKLRPIHLFHGSAFVLSIGLLIPFYYTKPPEIQEFVIDGLQEGEATVFIVISVVGILYELAYLTAIKMELYGYRRRIRERFSNIDKVNLSWLHFIVNVFIISFVANSLASFIRHTTLNNLDEASIIFGMMGFFFFINSVLLQGLHQNEVFLAQPARSTRAAINEEKRKELQETLESHMKDLKPYLDPELTIDQLAGQLNIQTRELSSLINNEMGQTFFDMINNYRIEEAKHQLSQKNDNKLTISEVMYQVGFNSKSSFNTAFKKYTGTTPSAYKTQVS